MGRERTDACRGVVEVDERDKVEGVDGRSVKRHVRKREGVWWLASDAESSLARVRNRGLNMEYLHDEAEYVPNLQHTCCLTFAAALD